METTVLDVTTGNRHVTDLTDQLTHPHFDEGVRQERHAWLLVGAGSFGSPKLTTLPEPAVHVPEQFDHAEEHHRRRSGQFFRARRMAKWSSMRRRAWLWGRESVSTTENTNIPNRSSATSSVPTRRVSVRFGLLASDPPWVCQRTHHPLLAR